MACKRLRAGFFYGTGDTHELFFRFHGTGPGHNGQGAGADPGIAHLDTGRLRMKFAVGKLIGFRDGNDPVHIFETDKVFGGKFCFVPIMVTSSPAERWVDNPLFSI